MSEAPFFSDTGPIPLWLLAELTYSCPLQCPYCSNPLDFHSSRKHELNAQQWIDVLKQARKLGAVQLGFSGGEPMLRKDIMEILAAAKELGFYCNLITSSIGLDKNKIAEFKRIGLDHIQISFQGSNRETNRQFGGTDSFEHKLEMTREVIRQDIALGLNFVLHRHNLHQVEDFLTLAYELKAEFVELANTQYYGWALENRQALLPSLDQLKEAEAIAVAFREANLGMDVFFVAPDYYETRPKKCCNGWGTTFMTVAPNGDVLPCQSARVIPDLDFPNVLDLPLSEIWRDSEAFNRYRGLEWMKEPCRSCPEKEVDFGGCRCQAYLLTGDADAADPVCDLSPFHNVIENTLEQAAVQVAASETHAIVWRNARNAKLLANKTELLANKTEL